jgi:hypothetical protein
MATYTNTWRNKVWMGWFFMQLPIILCKSTAMSPCFGFRTTGLQFHATPQN